MGVVAKLKRAMTTMALRPVELDTKAVDAGALRVLVVDDDQHILDTAEALFIEQGFVPILISSPQSALQIARSMQPFVIFLDVLMPGFDGWDVLAALQADPETRDIPVVMISMLGERGRALKSGAVGVLPKPLDAPKLRATMASVISQAAQKRDVG